ncbi:hypothetical protein A5777_23860 [Gordonia sp. 852002-10350_SCH5691597]|nr:hypothetical protein A5777_23860 [Gordonia sp. 852002-10350_SCH5691597]
MYASRLLATVADRSTDPLITTFCVGSESNLAEMRLGAIAWVVVPSVLADPLAAVLPPSPPLLHATADTAIVSAIASAPVRTAITFTFVVANRPLDAVGAGRPDNWASVCSVISGALGSSSCLS